MRIKIACMVVLLVSLLGCNTSTIGWDNAPSTHVCTQEQMKKVQEETIFCKKETNYYGEVCYGTAIMRNCNRRTP